MRELRWSAGRTKKGSGVVSVHLGNEIQTNFLGASSLARTRHCTVAEPFLIHLLHHRKNTLIFFNLSLRQQAKVPQFS